ncbi:protein indeterminate-domain 7-like [Abeliophyllum distichum]|uniref:Protein indeterminate-domain 7-like n=1 Tax=Abeliophyllum distichum TaxID=126358 RepID=A0ABD1RQS0_9LAMI
MSSRSTFPAARHFTVHSTFPGAPTDDSTSGLPPTTTSLLHDMMMNNPRPLSSTGFEGSTFEDAFGGILNSLKKDENFHATHNQFSRNEGGNGVGIDGTTRDFLGLRPIFHSEILSFTGLDHNCINTSYEDRNENPKSWKG